MGSYIMQDANGNILSASDERFEGSVYIDENVVYGSNGRLYVDRGLYAKPGTSEQLTMEEKPGDDFILMSGPRPEDVRDATGAVTATWVAGDDGEWQPFSVLPAKVRAERDTRLNATNWLVERHAEQTGAGVVPTLSEASYTALLAYRQALRDIPQQDGFPWTGPDDPACLWPVSPVGA